MEVPHVSGTPPTAKMPSAPSKKVTIQSDALPFTPVLGKAPSAKASNIPISTPQDVQIPVKRIICEIPRSREGITPDAEFFCDELHFKKMEEALATQARKYSAFSFQELMQSTGVEKDKASNIEILGKASEFARKMLEENQLTNVPRVLVYKLCIGILDTFDQRHNEDSFVLRCALLLNACQEKMPLEPWMFFTKSGKPSTYNRNFLENAENWIPQFRYNVVRLLCRTRQEAVEKAVQSSTHNMMVFQRKLPETALLPLEKTQDIQEQTTTLIKDMLKAMFEVSDDPANTTESQMFAVTENLGFRALSMLCGVQGAKKGSVDELIASAVNDRNQRVQGLMKALHKTEVNVPTEYHLFSANCKDSVAQEILQVRDGMVVHKSSEEKLQLEGLNVLSNHEVVAADDSSYKSTITKQLQSSVSEFIAALGPEIGPVFLGELTTRNVTVSGRPTSLESLYTMLPQSFRQAIDQDAFIKAFSLVDTAAVHSFLHKVQHDHTLSMLDLPMSAALAFNEHVNTEAWKSSRAEIPTKILNETLFKEMQVRLERLFTLLASEEEGSEFVRSARKFLSKGIEKLKEAMTQQNLSYQNLQDLITNYTRLIGNIEKLAEQRERANILYDGLSDLLQSRAKPELAKHQFHQEKLLESLDKALELATCDFSSCDPLNEKKLHAVSIDLHAKTLRLEKKLQRVEEKSFQLNDIIWNEQGERLQLLKKTIDALEAHVQDPKLREEGVRVKEQLDHVFENEIVEFFISEAIEAQQKATVYIDKLKAKTQPLEHHETGQTKLEKQKKPEVMDVQQALSALKAAKISDITFEAYEEVMHALHDLSQAGRMPTLLKDTALLNSVLQYIEKGVTSFGINAQIATYIESLDTDSQFLQRIDGAFQKRLLSSFQKACQYRAKITAKQFSQTGKFFDTRKSIAAKFDRCITKYTLFLKKAGLSSESKIYQFSSELQTVLKVRDLRLYAESIKQIATFASTIKDLPTCEQLLGGLAGFEQILQIGNHFVEANHIEELKPIIKEAFSTLEKTRGKLRSFEATVLRTNLGQPLSKKIQTIWNRAIGWNLLPLALGIISMPISPTFGTACIAQYVNKLLRSVTEQFTESLCQHFPKPLQVPVNMAISFGLAFLTTWCASSMAKKTASTFMQILGKGHANVPALASTAISSSTNQTVASVPSSPSEPLVTLASQVQSLWNSTVSLPSVSIVGNHTYSTMM
jgi:hypothetical protein